MTRQWERGNQSRQNMRTMTSRAIATAAAALIALTTMSLQPAAAGWRDDATALTAFGAVLGTVAAVIAAEHYSDRPAYAPAPAYRYDGDHHAYAHGRAYRDRHEHGWRHDER
jgi:cytosine/uracil/thiamine/allantoin permease